MLYRVTDSLWLGLATQEVISRPFCLTFHLLTGLYLWPVLFRHNKAVYLWSVTNYFYFFINSNFYSLLILIHSINYHLKIRRARNVRGLGVARLWGGGGGKEDLLCYQTQKKRQNSFSGNSRGKIPFIWLNWKWLRESAPTNCYCTV